MDILRLRSITAADDPAAAAAAAAEASGGESVGTKTKKKKKNTNKNRKGAVERQGLAGDEGSGSGEDDDEEEEEAVEEREESILEGWEGWGELSARNVLDAVDKAKDVSLGRWVRRMSFSVFPASLVLLFALGRWFSTCAQHREFRSAGCSVRSTRRMPRVG